MAKGMQIASLFVALGADISEFERKMDRAVTKVEQAGKGLTRAGSMLTKAVTLPLLAMSGAAAKFSIDFESAFAGVRKTVDATEPEFQKLRRGILDMNAELPATAGQIASVVEQAGQLGIQNKNLLKFTRTMIDLGETSDISANAAAEALARMVNVMGTSQDDIDRIGAAITALGNTSATTESQIVEMAQRIAGAGAQVGLTEGEVIGLATALSSVGIRADAGGTAISKVFLNISKAVASGGDTLQRFAGIAGMSVDDFKQAFESDAAGAVTTFIEGLGQVKAAGGNVFTVLEDLEIQERRMIDALLRTANAGDLVRRSIENGNTAFEENTALVDEAAERYKTTESQIRKAAGSAQNAAIAVGDNLKGAIQATLVPLKGMFELIEQAAIAFGKLPLPIRILVGGLIALAAAIGPALLALGGLAKAMIAVQLAAQIMSAGVKRALITTGVGALLVALGTIAAMIISEWERVGPFFQRLWNGLILVAAQGIDKFLAQVQLMTAWIPGAAQAIGAARKKLSNVIDARRVRAQVLEYKRQIAEAKRSAEEASGSLDLDNLEVPDIDLNLPEPDETDPVEEALTALAESMENLQNRSKVMGEGVNVAQEKVSILEQALVALLDAGVDPASEKFKALSDILAEARGQLADLQMQAEPGVPELEPEKIDFDEDDFLEVQEPLFQFFANSKDKADEWAGAMANAIGGGINDAAGAFLEGVGKMAVGEASLGDVMKSVMGTLADMAIRVGKIAIGTGVAVKGIKTALQSLNPIAAIAAGAALIALGSAVKSKLAAASSGGGGGGGSAVGKNIGNFTPSIPDDQQRFGIRPDRSGGHGDTGTDRGSRSGGSDTSKKVVQVVPRSAPSGDLEYSIHEGTRRQDRIGNDRI